MLLAGSSEYNLKFVEDAVRSAKTVLESAGLGPT